MAPSYTNKIIIGISGATGIVYGIRLLQVLRGLGYETHLVVSRSGDMTRALAYPGKSVGGVDALWISLTNMPVSSFYTF